MSQRVSEQNWRTRTRTANQNQSHSQVDQPPSGQGPRLGQGRFGSLVGQPPGKEVQADQPPGQGCSPGGQPPGSTQTHPSARRRSTSCVAFVLRTPAPHNSFDAGGTHPPTNLMGGFSEQGDRPITHRRESRRRAIERSHDQVIKKS